ncbi:MAG: DUF3179 domain-containing protein [Salinispira sp.]
MNRYGKNRKRLIILILLCAGNVLSARPVSEEQGVLPSTGGGADRDADRDTGMGTAAEDIIDRDFTRFAAFFADPPLADADIPAEFQGQSSSASSVSSAAREFSGDFSRALVSFSEILSGGPPKDGIPAIDMPVFIDPDEAGWLEDRESVLLYEGERVLRVYPVQVLTYHEIVNDIVDGLPIAVTYCPLCNTGAAFASLDYEGNRLDFGVSGRLRYSNMIMYDRRSESWWQQATGRAIAGEYTGSELKFLPLPLVSWADVRDLSARLDKPIEVLSRNTGHNRPYGQNPYPGYDTGRPFLYAGPPVDGSFPLLERVIAVKYKNTWAYAPFSLLADEGFAEQTLAGDPVLFVYRAGVNSPLDSRSVHGGREVGSARAYLAVSGGMKLRFLLRDDGLLEDAETGSIWNHQGIAESGPLAGGRLPNLPAVNHFWFSWSAFAPETE